MDNLVHTISLIPYFCGIGDKFCLNISQISNETVDSKEHTYSIQPDYSEDLLGLGFKTKLQTDSGFTLSQLMLFIQRDEYPFFNSYLPEITNTVIDKYWFKAAQQVNTDQSPESNILFSEQFNKEGQYLPFASLFYCKKKELFFHPPCPRCGKMLLLCRDDELLGEFNLPHYSKSRNRFLYCPTCTPLHGGPWYTKTRQNEQIAVVKELEQLIHSFGSVQGTIAPDTCFPCFECNNHVTCFGSSPQAIDHIKCFSFYPFYMMVSPDITSSGHHYLATLSGATEQQLNSYWSQRGISPAFLNNKTNSFSTGNNGFLFPVEDPRHFLEVLYLKLLFIKNVSEKLLHNSYLQLTSNYLTTHSIGISLENHSVLPYFWTLNIVNSDLFGDLTKLLPSPKYPEINQAYIIGLFWFSALLSNSNQDEAEIMQHLKQLLESPKDETLVLRNFHSTFQAEQLFWAEVSPHIDTTQWNSHWDKVLNTGYALLYSGYCGKSLDNSSILSSINGCLQELKTHLLPPRQGKKKVINPSENLEILDILSTVEKRWRKEVKDSISIDDPDQTVIIPVGSVSQRPPELTIPKPTETELPSGLEETVLISRPNDNLEQTSPIPNEQPTEPAIAPSSPREEDQLEKTVRIQPTQATEQIEPQIPQKKSLSTDNVDTQEFDDDDDFLTETVVLRPMKKGD